MITQLPSLPSLQSFERLSKSFSDLWPESTALGFANHPTVDIKETEKEFQFKMDLPGVDEKEIEVEVLGDRLSIKAHREFERDEKRDDYVRLERSYGTYQRTFTLNFPVKPDQIAARYEKGVLYVTVPKSEATNASRVPVRFEGK